MTLVANAATLSPKGFPAIVTRFHLQTMPAFSHARSAAYTYEKKDARKALEWVTRVSTTPSPAVSRHLSSPLLTSHLGRSLQTSTMVRRLLPLPIIRPGSPMYMSRSSSSRSRITRMRRGPLCNRRKTLHLRAIYILGF